MADMTPQGLADAIEGLVRDLPKRERAPSQSWQKVLAAQALEAVFDYTTPMGSVIHAAVEQALAHVLVETPALLGAIDTAFPHCDYRQYDDEADDPMRTAFGNSFQGQLLRHAADHAGHLVGVREQDAAEQAERRLIADRYGDFFLDFWEREIAAVGEDVAGCRMRFEKAQAQAFLGALQRARSDR